MREVAIRVENLGKRYRIGAARERHDTLRDAVTAGVQAPLRRLRRGTEAGRDTRDMIWALKDVSFEVQAGEVLGIIGRNGAGKTTLLKILSRITEPTDGRAEIRGRVGSLLEVGTGFHPELTGRENIYLSGAILGMRRHVTERKFDEIVDFSGVEKFIDTPIKRYSSGMNVRLGFAVAAHLEPEILLVDEVLAVGDAAFQRKCLGKMEDVSRQGRTVLFVSHNMGAMRTLCPRGILLDGGTVKTDGDADQAIACYLNSLEATSSQLVGERTDRRGQGSVRLTGVDISNCASPPSGILATGGAARFAFSFDGRARHLSCIFAVRNHRGEHVLLLDSAEGSPDDKVDPRQESCFVCHLNELTLLPGHYRIDVAIRSGRTLEDHVESVAAFDVEEGQLAGRRAKRNTLTSVSSRHRWILPPG
ncbi:ABC transporter ATP-binding protein [Chloroflexota bacterium]